MTLDVSQLLLFGVFTSALHWFVARSEIARPLWSRAGGWLGALLSCAGCSGFWLGAAIGGLGVVTPLSLGVSPALYFDIFLRALTHGVLGIFVTPVFEAALLWGLHASTITVDEEPAPEQVPESRAASITPIDNPRRRP